MEWNIRNIHRGNQISGCRSRWCWKIIRKAALVLSGWGLSESRLDLSPKNPELREAGKKGFSETWKLVVFLSLAHGHFVFSGISSLSLFLLFRPIFWLFFPSCLIQESFINIRFVLKSFNWEMTTFLKQCDSI